MPIFDSAVDLNSRLSNLDWLVFAGACGLCIALIIYAQRFRSKSHMLEYLLMGRQLTLPLFVTTLVSTWYGGIFGVTQIAFEQGIYNLFTQGVFWYIAYICFAFFIVKKIRSYGALSLPDIVKNIYGPKSAKLAAIFVFIKTLPIVYAVSIGVFLQCFLPLSLVQATIAGVALISLYTMSGGLRTVVYSDIALFIIMCLGVSLVLVFSIAQFGGISFLQAKLPANYFTITGTKSIPNTAIWLFIAFSTTFISPCFYQRCLAAMDDKTAKRGILISTVIWFLFDICTTFGAMYAKAVIPDANSLNAYITYGMQLLPSGCRGLLLASMAAAIIGTLDSFMFIASNVLFYDLSLFRCKSISLRYSVAILITATLTIFMALHFEGKIEHAWLLMKSYFTACLLLPVLFGYFMPRLASERVFVVNAIVTCSSITVWRYCFAGQEDVDGFYVGCFVSCLVFGVRCVVKYEFNSTLRTQTVITNHPTNQSL
jgi:SSS family solute:Na+ symporter